MRDKTKFIPKSKMTTMDYESDYRFLEECTRFVATRKRDPIKEVTSTQGLPQHLIRLRTEAGQRKTTLRFLFANFTKRKENTTRLDVKTKKIFWRVQWILVNCLGTSVVDCSVDETVDLCDAFEAHLQSQSSAIADLDFYKSRSMNDLVFLLKAEGIPNCSSRFYEVDIRRPLKETLQNKIIVEFPVIHVTFSDCRSQYDIIPEDEEVDLLATAHLPNKKIKLELMEVKTEPGSGNLLFSNENFWQSSDEEDEGEGDLKHKVAIKEEKD